MSPTTPLEDGELTRRFGPTVTYAERADLFTLTGVLGVDPATGTLAEGLEEQFSTAFRNVQRIGDLVGFSPGEIGRLTVFTPDAANRPAINPPWLELFPTEDRPARKTTHVPLAPGVHIELEVVGVHGGGARQSIEMLGLHHGDPLPMGARIGRYVFSSVLLGLEPGGSGAPGGVREMELLFSNLDQFMRDAGGSLDDVANIWTYLGRWDLHPEYVDLWCEFFGDEHSRPSRKTFYYPRIEVQLQCEAVIGGARANFEIPGITHHDPMPMGAVTGGVFTSSGIDGRDPATGREPRGVSAQSRTVFSNLAVLLGESGLSTRDLLHVTGLVGNRRYIPEFEQAFREAFPDPATAPAWQVMELGLPARDMLVQVVARAVGSP